MELSDLIYLGAASIYGASLAKERKFGSEQAVTLDDALDEAKALWDRYCERGVD